MELRALTRLRASVADALGTDQSVASVDLAWQTGMLDINMLISPVAKPFIQSWDLLFDRRDAYSCNLPPISNRYRSVTGTNKFVMR
jgi:hypothetical protein